MPNLETAYSDFMAIVKKHADREKELEAEVERLQGIVERFPDDASPALYDHYRDRCKELEAEVERLRAALERIANPDLMRLGWGQKSIDLARAALAKEEARA